MITTATELRSAAAVRERCAGLYDAGLEGRLAHLRVDASAHDRVVEATVEQILSTHPEGPIPIHGRLNHLRSAQYDLTTDLGTRLGPALLDFVILSVLVDAGAGPAWRFDDPTAGKVGRSEGLALASLRALEAGTFHHEQSPGALSVDGLASLDDDRFAMAFQVSDTNPLLGVPGRADLLRSFGTILAEADAASSWELLQSDLSPDRDVRADDLLRWVLTRLAALWPGRIELDGQNLGDTWAHPMAGGHGPTAGLVPFHKLSQWMTYSLVEPLDALGLRVTDLDALTGLAEYRNGGMFIELDMFVPVDGHLPASPLAPHEPAIVEWRALTVAGLDAIASDVRHALGPDRADLRLASILEAGTWPLGRRLAYERDPAGTPPIQILSDGTVF